MKEVQFQSEYGYKQDGDTEQRQNRSEEEKLKRKENAVESGENATIPGHSQEKTPQAKKRMRVKDVEGEKVAH